MTTIDGTNLEFNQKSISRPKTRYLEYVQRLHLAHFSVGRNARAQPQTAKHNANVAALQMAIVTFHHAHLRGIRSGRNYYIKLLTESMRSA